MTKKLLESTPYSLLLPAALLLGLAPFYPQPHLIEKIAMLLHGELKRIIDVFDLLLHSLPIVLLVLKVALSRSRDAA